MTKVDLTMSDAIRAAYRRGEDEETMNPIVRVDKSGQPIGRIEDGDYVIFYDIRGEREIELTEAFVKPNFSHFPVVKDLKTRWATMIEYDKKLGAWVAFPPIEQVQNTLSETVSKAGLKQAKISEAEKSIHLSYFFNGKNTTQFPGEERIVVETRKDVSNFDECPEMSTEEVANQTIAAIRSGQYDLMVTNFANIDVVGHIENRPAVIKAIETVDTQVQRVVEAAKQAGVTVFITSDHGSAEKWLYPEGTIDTGHSNSPVHAIFIAAATNGSQLRNGGSLIDVAPTLLQLLQLPQPAGMTGRSLLQNYPINGRHKVLLLITDGWGHNENAFGNLIMEAHTPYVDSLKQQYPNTILLAAGEAVGLPAGTVGNSESGHMHMGAGRVIYADRLRIANAMKDGSYHNNEAFLQAMSGAKKDGTRLHLLGIVSFFSSHGSVDYLIELMRMAKAEQVPEVFIHGLLGRRGERPETGAVYTQKIEAEAAELGLGQVVSIVGRYWALDREENWDRIEKTYRMLVHGEGTQVYQKV